MAVNLLLATLTTALIVNTWLDRNGLFVPLLKRLQRQTERTGVLAFLSRGALCRYCFCHWVAAGIALFLAPTWTLYLPFAAGSAWLATNSISAYSLMAEAITVARWHHEIQKVELHQLMHASQAKTPRQDTSAAA